MEKASHDYCCCKYIHPTLAPFINWFQSIFDEWLTSELSQVITTVC